MMPHPIQDRPTTGKTAFIGDAGEHFVLAELLRRRIVAALAPRNIANYDILAVEGSQSLKIRVKTKTAAANSFRWNTKQDRTMFGPATENEVVVLVDLGDLKPPTYYALTVLDLERKMNEWMARWLALPDRAGKQRIDRGQRFLFTDWRGENDEFERSHLEQYEGEKAWGLIEELLGKAGEQTAPEIGQPQ
jgi:hypothetical protein